ncbi:hypothetical protein ACFLS0_04385 [Candidatus Bipolaricaulota bacterium]
MIQDNELFNAVLALAVLVFLFTQRRALQRLYKHSILLSAYGILFVGWVATIFEGLFWPNVLNIAEHICYACSALLFSYWCWVAFQSGSRNRS